MENPEGWGGHHFFQKTENPGRRGVPNEIPSVVGVWIFSGTAHCTRSNQCHLTVSLAV